jgi:hypothetical protein
MTSVELRAPLESAGRDSVHTARTFSRKRTIYGTTSKRKRDALERLGRYLRCLAEDGQEESGRHLPCNAEAAQHDRGATQTLLIAMTGWAQESDRERGRHGWFSRRQGASSAVVSAYKQIELALPAPLHLSWSSGPDPPVF